ncbi:hypothetical protein GCM10023148_14540 [Actinokineospora soli]
MSWEAARRLVGVVGTGERRRGGKGAVGRRRGGKGGVGVGVERNGQQRSQAWQEDGRGDGAQAWVRRRSGSAEWVGVSTVVDELVVDALGVDALEVGALVLETRRRAGVDMADLSLEVWAHGKADAWASGGDGSAVSRL